MLGLTVRTTVARWLEDGVLSGTCSRALARVHAPFASRGVARPLVVPPGLVTITIGGSTLGGSGKTRVALECVRELAKRGANVVLLGHGYRSRVAHGASARIVTPADTLEDVGDEALACARALAGSRVVVGPTRQAAIDLAARLVPRVDVVVIDGPLQLAPSRSSLSILAVDADDPWGAAGAVAPAGDLRAPREVLLAHADHVVTVAAMPSAATLAGERIELASLARSRLGLFTAIGRPRRLERALTGSGLALSVIVRAADHGPLSERVAAQIAHADVDLWLATEKCALHLEGCEYPKRLVTLDSCMVLPRAVVAALARLAAALEVRHAPTCMA